MLKKYILVRPEKELISSWNNFCFVFFSDFYSTDSRLPIHIFQGTLCCARLTTQQYDNRIGFCRYETENEHVPHGAGIAFQYRLTQRPISVGKQEKCIKVSLKILWVKFTKYKHWCFTDMKFNFKQLTCEA